jgi:hypothetical protein
MMRKVDELLEHVNVVLLWILDYTARHHIPVDDGLNHHIKRMQSILAELDPSAMLKAIGASSDERLQDDSSDDKVPKPRGTSLICQNCIVLPLEQ